MSKPLTIIAKLQVSPEKREELLNHIKDLTASTRKEEGCVTYLFHQDNNNPTLFTFYEIWASYDAFLNHKDSVHFKDFVKKTENYVNFLDIQELNPLN